MKKASFIVLALLLTVSGQAFAQAADSLKTTGDKTGMEWIENLDSKGNAPTSKGNVLFDDNYYGGASPYYYNDFDPYFPPVLDHRNGMALYGSRYRKARSNKLLGEYLTLLVGGPGLLLFADGIAIGFGEVAALGAVVTGVGLGVGIPLWVKGQREMDAMIDDFSSRYVNPRARLSIAPAVQSGPFVSGGLAIALDF